MRTLFNSSFVQITDADLTVPAHGTVEIEDERAKDLIQKYPSLQVVFKSLAEAEAAQGNI